MRIKKIIWGLLNPNYKSSDKYCAYLRKNGCTIGKGTYFFDPIKTSIDIPNAHCIEIGNYCKITSGVHILAHDYSYSVLRRTDNIIPKKTKITKIGNNVFIGINSIILMGSDIGNNSIIGAGSVVSGRIPDNEVWGGNPARFICTLKDYKKKCEDNFEKSAKTYTKRFYQVHNRYPSIQELQYYSLLFLNNGNKKSAKNEYEKMSFNGDEKNEVVDTCINYNSKYKDYNSFLEECKRWEE